MDKIELYQKIRPYLDFTICDAFAHLLNGLSVRPIDPQTRSALNKLATLGYIERVGTRWPNVSYRMSEPQLESIRFQWEKIERSWQFSMGADSQTSITCHRKRNSKSFEIASELSWENSKRHFGENLFSMLLEAASVPLIDASHHRFLPKSLFSKKSFLERQFFQITLQGTLQLERMLVVILPEIKRRLIEEKHKRREIRRGRLAAAITREKTVKLSEAIIEKFQLERYYNILPQEIAKRQIEWEISRLLHRKAQLCGSTEALACSLRIPETSIERIILKSADKDPPMFVYLFDDKDIRKLASLIRHRSKNSHCP